MDIDIHFYGFQWNIKKEANAKVYYCLVIDDDVFLWEKVWLKLNKQLNVVIFLSGC